MDLNWYPRISNPYCWDIQIQRCEWSQGYKMTQNKLHVCCTSFVGGRDPQKVFWIDTQGSLTHIVEIFNFTDVSGSRVTKWPKVNWLLKLVNYFTCMQHFFVGSRDPQKWIGIDTQGSLTHIVKIFKFADVSGPRVTKWPKVNCLLKIVNYLTCMLHFFCR